MGTVGSSDNGKSMFRTYDGGSIDNGCKLEQSMNNLEQAVRAWKHANAALPVENLTPTQKKQRDHYAAELAALQSKLADLNANPRQPTNLAASASEALPWSRAMALIPGLEATQQWNSSVS